MQEGEIVEFIQHTCINHVIRNVHWANTYWYQSTLDTFLHNLFKEYVLDIITHNFKGGKIEVQKI